MPIIEMETWKPNPDRPGTVIFDSQRAAQDIFNELEAHLKADGRMPDEYFLLNMNWENGALFPKDADIHCNVNYGGSEGIYLDISVSYKKDVYERNQKDGELGWVNRKVNEPFATGKTLGDRIDDLDKMNLVASSVMTAFYGSKREIEERYAKIKNGEIQPVYPLSSEEQNEIRKPPEEIEPSMKITDEHEFERKMAELLPGVDSEGIKDLMSYAQDLDKQGTETKADFFTNTFTEFYLVTQVYGQETSHQLLDICKSFTLNPFEIRGAAYHLNNGKEPSEIPDLAVNGECDPPDGESLLATEALKAFQNGMLDSSKETAEQPETHKTPEQAAEKSKLSLEDRMKSAKEKADAHNAQNNKNKTIKKELS